MSNEHQTALHLTPRPPRDQKDYVRPTARQQAHLKGVSVILSRTEGSVLLRESWSYWYSRPSSIEDVRLGTLLRIH